jgi:hypothetical protein
MYISHQYYIPVHVALKSQSFLGVKSHHFSLPYICISIVVVLGMFRYGSLYTFRGSTKKFNKFIFVTIYALQ